MILRYEILSNWKRIKGRCVRESHGKIIVLNISNTLDKNALLQFKLTNAHSCISVTIPSYQSLTPTCLWPHWPIREHNKLYKTAV